LIISTGIRSEEQVTAIEYEMRGVNGG
jgi:hypothetical protein